MADLYHRSTPFSVAQFRDRTARQTMLNVQSIPKRRMCVCCGKMRTEKTGHVTKAGFVCGMCR